MATLLSPGVDVEITDESFYASSGNGTVPLIIFATQANKASPTGSGIAPGTVAGTAGKLYNITSQRELIQTFGNPYFETVSGTTVYGSELNEYGLHAAYQFLGISNSAYVLRADIDMSQLSPNEFAPTGAPVNGTVWFDTTDTLFGAFQSTGAAGLSPFNVKAVTVYSQTSQLDSNGYPLAISGQDGDYGIVTANAPFVMFERINTNNVSAWYPIGSNAWKLAKNIIRGSVTANVNSVVAGDSFTLSTIDGTKGTTVVMPSSPNGVADIVAAITTAVAGSNMTGLVTASYDSAGRIVMSYSTGIVLANLTNAPLAYLGLTAGSFPSVSLTFAPHNKVPKNSVLGDVWIKTTTPNQGANYAVKVYNTATGAYVAKTVGMYIDDAAAASALGSTGLVSGAVYVQYGVSQMSGNTIASFDLRTYNGSTWNDLVFEQGATAPTTAPAQGTMWYSTDFRVDIMYGTGERWIGYRNAFPATDPNGVILSGSAPETQSTGNALVDNDLWIDTSALETYPMIYRFAVDTQEWVLIDNTDQTTPYGIIFSDARANSGIAYTDPLIANPSYTYSSELEVDMVLSNFVDPDAVDPRTMPEGMLMFNTRYSTYNVKEYQPNWFKKGGFETGSDFTQNAYNVGDDAVLFPATTAGRWVTVSGNDVDGSPFMGRKAQRQMIIKAMAAQLVSNEDIRSEIVYFNLIAAPGYVELLSDMVTLNNDCKEVAFIIGDTPARLTPDATTISRWAGNANNVATDGDDGLVTHNSNIGLYYPWGFSTNIDGSNVVVPPSTMALYTYAYNDQIAYPWYAPAGFTRGLVSNATSVGYIDSEEEYQTVILNPGQRDTLYTSSINPIAYIPNRGLVIYGQKTLNPVAQATDRVNVARLCNYLSYQLDLIAKPFLFEQNDPQTRDAFKTAIDRFLSGLIGLQALNDYAVVCDTTNNTNARIDANELWCDIYIQPIKAIEFIYLPVRIQNTGATN